MATLEIFPAATSPAQNIVHHHLVSLTIGGSGEAVRPPTRMLKFTGMTDEERGGKNLTLREILREGSETTAKFRSFYNAARYMHFLSKTLDQVFFFRRTERGESSSRRGAFASFRTRHRLHSNLPVSTKAPKGNSTKDVESLTTAVLRDGCRAFLQFSRAMDLRAMFK